MKNISQFTPGPWFVFPTPAHVQGAIAELGEDLDGTFYQVGKSPDFDGCVIDNIAADARLIAAAPTMHQALRDIVDALHRAKLLDAQKIALHALDVAS